MLTERFSWALQYAHRLHAQQHRKGPIAAPYISHLLGVASLVLESGGTEDEAIGALLHDSLEDIGGHIRLEILEHFGSKVLEIVEDCSDAVKEVKMVQGITTTTGDAGRNWLKRKQEYLSHLPEKPLESRWVSLADKLYNARAIQEDLRDEGETLWERFTGGKWGTLWYYRSLDLRFALTEGPSGYLRLKQIFDRTIRETEILSQTSNIGLQELIDRFENTL